MASLVNVEEEGFMAAGSSLQEVMSRVKGCDAGCPTGRLAWAAVSVYGHRLSLISLIILVGFFDPASVPFRYHNSYWSAEYNRRRMV